MHAYALDLRERILGAVDDGEPQREVARRFDVSRATVQRYVRLRRETGRVVPRPRPGPAPRLGAAAQPALRAQLAAAPDATLAQHCAAWERDHGVRVSVATMHRAIARLGWTRKKRPSPRPNATPRPARSGGSGSPPSPPTASSSSMRRGATSG